MLKPETTVPSILRNFDKTGQVPVDMLPLQPFDNEPDPTKPLRGAFEAILLARAAQPALVTLRQELSQRHKPWVQWSMIPISEIDEENDQDVKVELLERKRSYVTSHFRENLERSLNNELDQEGRKRLPRRVVYAYEQLDQIEEPSKQVEGIASAAETLDTTLFTLFHIAEYDYSSILGYPPSVRQMVNLVGNSYSTFVHLLAARHVEVRMPVDRGEYHMGNNFTIDISGEEHKIALINPAQYVQREKEMREKGEIVSQTIHCPFSISSQFTEPFLDSDLDPFDTNPLKHTFQTLVKEFIGA